MDFPSSGELQKILDDKTSGSEELLSKLNSYLLNCIPTVENPPQLFAELKNLFPSFQVILFYLDHLIEISRNRLELENFLMHHEERQIESLGIIFEAAKNDLKNYTNLITISNSSTVTAIIKKLHSINNDLTIYISESRPMFEGRITAENLSTHKMKNVLITEAMIPQYVQKCDAAIIGADKILNDGSIVNKIGSLSIALACKYYSKPFYVVTRKMKKHSDTNFTDDEHNPDEIWAGNHGEIAIKNSYFEIVKAELITKIFTD